MALTQADLDRLDTAIAGNTLEVEFNGQRIKYRDTDSLLAARAHVANVISTQAADSAGTRRASYHYTFTDARD